MALHFCLKKVENSAVRCYNPDGTLSKRTETLVFVLRAVGYSKITKANYRNVFRRTWVWEKVNGDLLGAVFPTDKELGPSSLIITEPFALSDIRNHIGLSTNATNRTDAQFGATLFNELMRDADDEIEKQEKLNE